MTDAIDLTTEQRNQLSDLLRRFLPDVAVWAYGSRVKGTARRNSDLDLVAFATPAQRRQVSDLKDALDESNLPFPVDLHVWDDVPERFREIIHQEYVVVQEAEQLDKKKSITGEWNEMKLGDAIELKRGYDLPGHDRRDGPFPIVSSSGISGRHVEAKAKAPGVVIGRYGTLGEVHYVTEDYWPLNTALYVRDFKGNDPRFVSYFLRSLDFSAYSDKAAVPGLNRNDLHTAQISLPPCDEQRAIAHILGTLDDKIELNRRMNETLEAMARALFKSWFVDFDPVRAKAEGRDPGLPKPLVDLFPSRLVDSELGEIPEGWEVGTLGDVVEQLRDNENPLDSPEIVFEHFSIPAFDNGQCPTRDLGETIMSQKTRVPSGSVLMSKLNPEIERVWLVDVQPVDRAVCSTEFLVLRPRSPYGRAYTYCLARSPELRRELEGLVTGTSKSHQRAQASSVLALGVARPLSEIVQRYEKIAEPLLAQTIECRRESRTLAALRDTLLPKLISGELRVKDAKRFMERGCESTAWNHESYMV